MFSGLELTVALLAAAVFGVVIFRMLHLPPMLGYLAVGILIGPHALGLAEKSHTTDLLAEFGVVFLMFSIGLEFSLPKLVAMRRTVFGLGMAQMVVTILAVMGIALAVSWLLPEAITISWQAAFALGAALGMSSTAIVSKLLTERLELESEQGRRVISILLFQDLAVVPLLIVVPSLAQSPGNMVGTLGLALGKAVVVLALLLFVGQRLVRWWMRIVAMQRSQELFILNLLLMTVGAAWITEHAGLSLALGAFVVGMLISETEYRHQVEEDIKPFRDVLLGLFFITIGMLLDVRMVLANWWIILLLLIGLMTLKLGIIVVLARFAGATPGVALRTGLALAQAGEFGFVLLNQAGSLQLLDPLLVQIILASMVLSMLATPFLIEKSDAIVLKFSANEWMTQSLALTQLAARTMNAQKHVVIAGFGRSGQNLAKMLEQENIPYHALDLDPERIQKAQAAGANVSYGDAGRREILVAAGIHRASALIISYADTAAALRTMHFAHELVPGLPIIVRSYDDTDLDRLRAAGATEVVPETIEGSLMLASHALLMLGVPLRRVISRVQEARSERYASLRGYFHGLGDAPDDAEHLHLRLHTILLTEGAKAIGNTIASLDLDRIGAQIVMVRRGKRRIDFQADTILESGDSIVVRGSKEAVALAEERLLKA